MQWRNIILIDRETEPLNKRGALIISMWVVEYTFSSVSVTNNVQNKCWYNQKLEQQKLDIIKK